MSATRLLVLGVVRMKGHAHGYEVRRELLSWGADGWANIQPGSVYHAVKKLTRDGLLAEVATEEGNGGPDRTVYQLTPDGETEFRLLVERALVNPDQGAESLSAAATFVTTLTRAHAIGLLTHRRAALEGSLARARLSVDATTDMGKPEHVAELFRLWVVGAEASIRWTSELISRLEAGQYVMADDSADHFGSDAAH